MEWILNSFNGYGGFVWGSFGLSASLLLGYFWYSWQSYQQAKTDAQQHQAFNQAFESEFNG